MMQLGACLQHLHVNGFLHADFKPLNAVRTSSSHIWKLIDLDASCKLGCDYVGKKVSTAYIPPECLKRKDDLESIEIVPLLASTSFDLWSFGVVLYHMLTGQPLFHSNNDDNLANSEELAKLYHWDDFEFEEKLVSLIPSVDRRSCVAKNLLGWLLTKDPTMRPQSMQQVLDHNFFQSDPTKGITRVTRGFFISHAQESGGVQSRAIKRMLADACPLLQKPIQNHLEDPIWLDVDEVPGKENMLQGVRRCQNIILFLTKGTLRRWFCQLEIREAMRLSKNIILVHDEPSLDPNFGGYTSFDGYIEDSRVGDAIEIEGKFGNTVSLFNSIVSIPYYHRKEFTEVSIQAILKAGGFDTNETIPRSFVNSAYNVLESVKPLIMRQQYQSAVNILQGVINSPLNKVTVKDEFHSSKHLNILILYEKMSHQTVTELKLLIERDFTFLANKVVVGTDLNHNLEEYSHLIIYVTIGVFRDSLVLKNLGSLDRISSKVIFVHATDTRHRAAKKFNDVIENATIDENKLIYIKKLFHASDESSEWGQSIPYYSQNSEFRTVSIKLIVKEILEK
jgi:serine/threonine protein kinase